MSFRFLSAAASVLAALACGGCESARKLVLLPYTPPAIAATGTAPAAEIGAVSDAREERELNMFLGESTEDFMRRALAAELVAGRALPNVAPRTGGSPAPLIVDVVIRDVSSATPNQARNSKATFWITLLGGGAAGVAYGLTDTAVLGHAAIVLQITDRATGKTAFNQTIEAFHVEKVNKFKEDSLDTRAQVMATVLKKMFTQAAQAVAQAHPAIPPP